MQDAAEEMLAQLRAARYAAVRGSPTKRRPLMPDSESRGRPLERDPPPAPADRANGAGSDGAEEGGEEAGAIVVLPGQRQASERTAFDGDRASDAVRGNVLFCCCALLLLLLRAVL